MRKRSPVKGGSLIAVIVSIASVMAAEATEPLVPLKLSSLAGEPLRTGTGARVLKLQDVTGDSRVDLLVARAQPLQGGAIEWRIEAWERDTARHAVGADATDGFFLSPDALLLPGIRDLQGVYVPGGTAGAGRDLIALTDAATDNLVVYRNQGPGTEPRFAEVQRLSLAGARRLHYFALAPPPPADPGFVNFPLPITLDSGAFQVLRFAQDGRAQLLEQPLEHPGGAEGVLIVDAPFGAERLLSVGAGAPRLWIDNGTSYDGSALDLPGWPSDDTAIEALLDDLDGVPDHPDLVVGFESGRVLRWNGVAPADPHGAPAFAAPEVLAEAIQATALVPFRSEGPVAGQTQPALVVAGQPETLIFAAGTPTAGSPIQRLPAALAAFGDFGLDLLFIATPESGVLAFKALDGLDQEGDFVFGWDSVDPLPVFDGKFRGVLAASRTRGFDTNYSMEYRLPNGQWIPVVIAREAEDYSQVPGQAFVTRFPAGAASDVFKARRPPPEVASQATTAVRLLAEDPDLLAAPAERPAFDLLQRCDPIIEGGTSLSSCFGGCIATYARLVQSRSPSPAKQAKLGPAIDSVADTGSLDLLRRFRGEVLAESAKGREYVEHYEALSSAAHDVLIKRPSLFMDYVNAHLDWLPAIRSLVEADGSAVITEEMVGQIETVARTLLLDGNPRLRQVIEREYRLIEPRRLVGMSMAQARQLYESLPTERIFRNGFEP